MHWICENSGNCARYFLESDSRQHNYGASSRKLTETASHKTVVYFIRNVVMTSHLILLRPEREKYKHFQQSNVHCVHVDWVLDSLSKRHCQVEGPYDIAKETFNKRVTSTCQHGHDSALSNKGVFHF